MSWWRWEYGWCYNGGKVATATISTAILPTTVVVALGVRLGLYPLAYRAVRTEFGRTAFVRAAGVFCGGEGDRHAGRTMVDSTPLADAPVASHYLDDRREKYYQEYVTVAGNDDCTGS